MTELLDLSVLTDHPTIKLDGTAYALRHREELSLLDDHRIMAVNKVMAAFQIDNATEEQVDEAAKGLDAVLGILCPDLPLGGLTDMQKLSVMGAWAKQYADEEAAPDGDGLPTKAPTGAS